MAPYATIIKHLQTAPRSLAELLPAAQVSLPTLRKLIQELTDARWVRVVGQAEANGGRPAMLFGLDSSYYAILGVHMQLPGMRLILSDLNGSVLDERAAYEDVQPTPDQVVQEIIDYAAEVRARFEHRHLLGVGIAAPGFTDPSSGDIISIERVVGWQNFPICQRLGAALGVPVRIANDIDCMAFAEFQHTGKSFAQNLAYFGFDEGLKVSMFLNGALYRGSFGNAGLIVSRFLRVPPEAAPAGLSPQDQARILTISGVNQMFAEQIAALPPDERGRYAAMLGPEISHRTRLRMILEGAEAGLPVCAGIADMLIAVIATAITNIVYVVQPDTIVIGGVLSGLPRGLFTRLSAAIRANLPALFANQAHIEQAQFTSINGAARGANYHFLEWYLTEEQFVLDRAPQNGHP